MERLTHKARYQAGYKVNRNVHDWECIDKLGQLEDAEEQGLILRLPIPLDTTVYSIDWQIFIDEKGCKDCVYYAVDGSCDYEEEHPACMKVFETKFKFTMRDDFGKTVFATKAEAEQALAEMRLFTMVIAT